MDKPIIAYTSHPDATPESEAATLAAVYDFVLRCAEARRAEEKKGGGPTTARNDDSKENKNDRDATPIISK